MAKVNRVRRLKHRCNSDKAERYHRIPSCSHKIFKDMKKNPSKLSEKKDWEDATCSVCMEPPHNAVLLLCSSYNKGCRPYMCATSFRFSNCLDQYKKAYSKANQTPTSLNEKSEVSELLCPLCRGQVKGWTLVEPARKYLNKKKRTCMYENCSFVGNYKQLKKHVKAEHPWEKPREVDPSLEEEWKRLERERERNDVISTFGPGTIIMGDYVLERNFIPFFGGYDMEIDDMSEDDDDIETFGGNNRMRSGGFQLHRTLDRSFDLYDDLDEDDEEEDDDIGVHRHSSFTRDRVGSEVLPLSPHQRRMRLLRRPHRRRWRRD